MENNNKVIDMIIMENDTPFDCMIIRPGSIEHVPWIDPKYSAKLMELNLYELALTNKDNFTEVVATRLEVDKYNVKNMSVKTEIVAEEHGYVYQLMYIDLEKEPSYHTKENKNEMASLINTNGDIIYSNAILFKNHISTTTDSMTLVSITKNDVERFLHNRVSTKIVTWEDSWRELEVAGDITTFANEFFDEGGIVKIEFPFLMHNINIWYTKFDYGRDVCGKLVNRKIDKCIWFTMKSDEFRGNLTLNEVMKIIGLSEKLSDYNTPSEMTTEKIDTYGRKIVYNKYKVLDYMYNKFF
jgi:hypothetical protein